MARKRPKKANPHWYIVFPGLREASPGGFKVVLNRTFLADSLAMGGVFGRGRNRNKGLENANPQGYLLFHWLPRDPRNTKNDWRDFYANRFLAFPPLFYYLFF